MIRYGDMLTLDIIETNMLGNGVAKVDDMIVFCHGAVEGDVVTALVTEVKKNYAEADCVKIVSPSPHRRDAFCPYAAKCGGCVFDGVTYEHECAVKAKGISSALRREGIRFEVSEFIGTGLSGYRNKAVFRFDGEGRCGYSAAGTNDVAAVDKCLICNEKIGIIKNEVEKLLALNGKVAADGLTYLYIRYMKETDEASVVIGYTGEESLAPIAEELREALPYVKCVMRGRGKSPESKDEMFELLCGSSSIAAKVAGLDMEVSPSSFFQVNTSGAGVLCDAVCRLAALKDGERAADLYCGTGLFGLALAKSSPDSEVYGIELNDDAVRCANRNAAKNGIKNAFFLQGDSSELKSKAAIDSLDVAVVDPPRTGLSKRTVAELVKLSPERIVYVSCNPSTLARDLKQLSDHYSIKDIVGVDMFPRTKHVETVCCLYHQKKDFISVPYEPKNAEYLQQLK